MLLEEHNHFPQDCTLKMDKTKLGNIWKYDVILRTDLMNRILSNRWELRSICRSLISKSVIENWRPVLAEVTDFEWISLTKFDSTGSCLDCAFQNTNQSFDVVCLSISMTEYLSSSSDHLEFIFKNQIVIPISAGRTVLTCPVLSRRWVVFGAGQGRTVGKERRPDLSSVPGQGGRTAGLSCPDDSLWKVNWTTSTSIARLYLSCVRRHVCKCRSGRSATHPSCTIWHVVF